MPLNIKDEDAQAIHEALERDLLKRDRESQTLANELDEIAIHSASLPLLDTRSAEEILGHDSDGMPGESAW